MSMPISFPEFEQWFESHTKKYLQPALDSAHKALAEHFDDQLRELDRQRVRVAPGRIKSKARTWQKLNLPKYSSQLVVASDIPDVLDDLVGLRLICTNTSDAVRAFDLVLGLPRWSPGSDPVLAVEADSERDYFQKVKESGYRALHVNLVTSVNRATGREPVRVELQIRTLLQDSWGELTHEDSYKPGGPVPQLVGLLSRRMADLLATLDDLAQDLREELDRLSEVAVNDEPLVESPTEEVRATSTGEAVAQFLAERVRALTMPIDLASLAWEVQREFGQEVVSGWLGHGSFKRLLAAAAPEVRITANPPTFVLPAGYETEGLDGSMRGSPSTTDLPEPLLAIKQVDKGFPLLSQSDYRTLFRWLHEAIASADEEVSDIRLLNAVTRTARDMAAQRGERLSRSHLDYVAKALLFNGLLSPRMSEDDIASGFATVVVKRLADLVLLSEPQIDTVRSWLTSAG